DGLAVNRLQTSGRAPRQAHHRTTVCGPMWPWAGLVRVVDRRSQPPVDAGASMAVREWRRTVNDDSDPGGDDGEPGAVGGERLRPLHRPGRLDRADVPLGTRGFRRLAG